MNTSTQEQREPKLLTGFELTQLIARNGRKLNLTPAESITFIALSTYYNNKPIYPRITTLIENTGLSDKGVRNSITGLLNKGYILKSKLKGNSNLYNINTNKVISTIESGTHYRTNTVQSTAPCHEQTMINKKTNKHVDVVSFNSVSEPEPPKAPEPLKNEIPEIILNNPTIRNAKAYWASLSTKAKSEWLEKQKTFEHEQQKKVELEKFRQNLKEQKELEEKKILEEMQKPLTQRFSRANAVKMCRNFRKLPMYATNKMLRDLIKAFNIDEKELI